MRIATEDWEFAEIHRLNYETFVEEIPQHEPNPSGRLVDRFHDQNIYIIAVTGRCVLGMVAIRCSRPFSLDHKLPDLDAYLAEGRRVCELRLLAVDKRYRAGPLLRRLLAAAWHYCVERGYDTAVISGTTRQLKLYRHLGFTPFGPLVGSSRAQFQPMMITREGAASHARKLFGRPSEFAAAGEPVNLLPGPIAVHHDVRRALEDAPESHRSPSFCADFASTQALLRQLSGAGHAQILVGSGTLANDAIAAQLSLTSMPGLILSNGEFGERLVDHAVRAGLAFDHLQWSWIEPFDYPAIERRLAQQPSPGWMWFVHVETSTGVINDFDSLTALCSRAGVRVCVDAISAFGLVPMDLRDIYFASAVSGKGLGAYPGLAIVFHNHSIEPSAKRLPRYLDLALYANRVGVPFTHSSNLVRALHTALERVDWQKRFRDLAETSAWLRAHLRQLGFEVVAAEAHAAPGVVTIALPAAVGSAIVGDELRRRGYTVAVKSEYLECRNWMQIGLMAQPSLEQLRAVVEALCELCSAPATE